VAISRYTNSDVILSKLETFPYVDPTFLYSENDIFVETASDTRLDILAREFMGDGRYWWIICLVNKLPFPFGIPAGSILRIPTNPQVALNAVNYAINLD